MAADSRERDSEAEGALPESQQEVTPVGHVPKNLLELSSAAEQNQNTRAYQAPAELLELATRRQREREQAKSPAKQSIGPSAPSVGPKSMEPKAPSIEARPNSTHAKVKRVEVRPPPPSAPADDAAPPRPIGESLAPRERPTRRPGRSEEAAESSAPSISVNPASSSDSMSFIDDGEPSDSSVEDAAPPVARSRPSRALSDPPGVGSAPRPPASLRELVRAAGDPEGSRERASASEESGSGRVESSARISTTTRPRTYYWALLVVLFIAVGFALAKWRALDLLLPR